jgi:hypothetical protein
MNFSASFYKTKNVYGSLNLQLTISDCLTSIVNFNFNVHCSFPSKIIFLSLMKLQKSQNKNTGSNRHRSDRKRVNSE